MKPKISVTLDDTSRKTEFHDVQTFNYTLETINSELSSSESSLCEEDSSILKTSGRKTTSNDRKGLGL